MTATRFDLIIVGAGLTGLMLAKTLADAGDPRTILLVDKGRSVGGRLATRRMGRGRADHGAQFFTVRDDRFARLIDEWQAAGIVYAWSHGWSAGSTDASKPDGHIRYAVRDGMNALAKHLAAEVTAHPNVDIRTGIRILSVSHSGHSWTLTDDQGNTVLGENLVLTAPVPQSLAMLAAGNVTLDPDDAHALARIEYAPCVCGLYQVEGPMNLPEPGAIQRPNAPIRWIADNRRKGISPDETVITVHIGPELSASVYGDEEVAERIMRGTLTPFLSADTRIVAYEIKWWRYALPLVLHSTRYVAAAGLPGLYFAGDAFGGPRVEGAALSGMSLGQVLNGESR